MAFQQPVHHPSATPIPTTIPTSIPTSLRFWTVMLLVCFLSSDADLATLI